MLKTLTVWDVELTDTFGGEANYSWVRRDQLALPQDASRRQIVTAAKAALGLTGCRCRTFETAEGFELRPVCSCTVAFVSPSY
jgi:hypothetical protein